MIELKLGEDKNIVQTAYNSNGGVVDLTSASITASFKATPASTAYLFQKLNTAAGGGDAQIEVLDATTGQYQIKVTRSDTSALTNAYMFLEIIITVGTADYKIGIKIVTDGSTNSTASGNAGETYGTTAERITKGGTLSTSDVGFKFYDTDLQTPYFWSGTEWT